MCIITFPLLDDALWTCGLFLTNPGVPMKFSILLYIFYLLLKALSFFSPSFKKRLCEKNLTLLITTENRSRKRYYIIKNGLVRSGKKGVSDPDMSLIWKDHETGYAYMRCRSIMAFMMAMRENSLKLEGKPLPSLWFMGIMGEMASYLKK